MRHATIKINSRFLRGISCRLLVLFVLHLLLISGAAGNISPSISDFNPNTARQYIQRFDFESLRLAIEDLTETFNQKYPNGGGYLERLNYLKKQSHNLNQIRSKTDLLKLAGELNALQSEAYRRFKFVFRFAIVVALD